MNIFSRKKKKTEKYKVHYLNVYSHENVVVFQWGIRGIGFGHTITDREFNVIDDECMGKDFCEQIIEHGLNKKGSRYITLREKK